MCSLLLPGPSKTFLVFHVKGGENSIPGRLVITEIALKKGSEGVWVKEGPDGKRKNIRKKDRHL